jgi:hypothetical protein
VQNVEAHNFAVDWHLKFGEIRGEKCLGRCPVPVHRRREFDRVGMAFLLDSRDSVFWLALAVGTRVVVAATALVPVVVAAAARVLFALATDGVVLDVSHVFFISPGGLALFLLYHC